VATRPQNQIIPVQWIPKKGGLNSDSDALNITDGDLLVSTINTGGMNIRAIGKGTNVTPSYEPIYGNTLAYELEAVTTQNKAFRLLVDIKLEPVESDYTLTLTTPSGNVLVTYSDTLTISDIATALSDLDAVIQAEFAAYLPTTSTTQTGSFTGYIDIEFTEAPFFNYIFSSLIDTGDVVFTMKITQEAIDPTMTGDWNLIGSDDKSGDDFQFFTTRNRPVREVDILTITNPSGSIVQVETLTPHGLIENQSVRIQGVVGTVEANGDWTAINVTLYTFELALCQYQSLYVSSGVVIIDFIGMGEIGVAQEDDSGVVFYTRLLRSREFNFSTYHQIDVRVKRKQDSRMAAYFTESRGDETIEEDSTNLPRVFYYQGEYVTDGALHSVVSDNIYEYGTISSELRWVLSSSDFSIRWVDQIQSGGQVKSGNWRYAARLVTGDFSKTNWCQLTEGVPVFSHNYTVNPLVIGNSANTPTPKINVLELTNNAIGLFKFVEVAAVNYIGVVGTSAYTLGLIKLNNQTTQTINHTGSENELLDLDAGELNIFSPGFLRAQNVELLEGRAILSNLTPAQVLDFTEFVKTFRYSLEREGLTPIGTWNTGQLQSGEYQIPANVYSKKSHMMMEQYRYGFQFKLKSGGYTQAFYPGYDIRIDLPPLPYPRERVAGSFTSFDLTDAGNPTEVYWIYINWLNIDLNYRIAGIPVSELVDEIIPVRATVIPEVLGHGVVITGVNGSDPTNIIFGQNVIPGAIGPNWSYFEASFPTIAFAAHRKTAFFYCPDLSWRINPITVSSNGDTIIPFGAPERVSLSQVSPFWTVLDLFYAEFNGYTGIFTNPAPNAITDGVFMPIAGGVLSATNQQFVPPNISIGGIAHSTTQTPYVGATPNPFYLDDCLGLRVASDIINTSAAVDLGFYRAIYFRGISDKYGNSATTVYTEALLPYVIGNNKGVVQSGDFTTQGDVFTQKTYLKHLYPGWWDRLVPNSNDGGGRGFGYYTQNRNNLQLRRKPTEAYSSGAVIQQLNYQAWLNFGFALPGTPGYGNSLNYVPQGLGRDSQLFYNQGYTPKNLIVTTRAYNPNADFQTDWGNAIVWSNVDTDGSNTDGNRSFPPLNIKFLDYTQGSITNAIALNGELITIQPREVQRQYFDTTSVFTTQDGQEVVLGSGAVLSRRGTTMNKFGSRHKWSIIIGLSDKGHDVLYGIDDIHNTAWRFGYDGTSSLDEIQKMKSFFANNLQWIRDKYTPAQDEGIRGVANNRYKEILWTLRGRKDVPEWVDSEITVTLIAIETTIGTEIIVNGSFNGSFYGWVSLDNLYAPGGNWTYATQPSGAGSAFKALGVAGSYLSQGINPAINPGEVYTIQITVTFISVDPIEISFQQAGPVEFTINTAGNYYFTYTAVGGDDNIYIFQDGTGSAVITFVSMTPVISSTNWLGAPTWTFGNNQACADGSDGDNLTQGIPDYLVVDDAYIVDYILDGITTGDVQLAIADQISTPESADGSYTFAATPTVPGVLSFIPSNGFDGCVKGNLRLTQIHPVTYVLGDVVQVPGLGFNQIPDLYECIVDESSGSLPTPSNPEWQLIPRTNGDYYTEYTIVYSELKDVFQSYMTPLPKIYAKFLNRYLVPRPVSNTGRLYTSDSGIPTKWFEQGGSVQTADAYFDATINIPQGRKRYLAVRVRSDIAPHRMRVTTPSGFSVTPSAAFVQREGNEFDGVVQNDATTTGISTGDTSIMQGDWGIFRFTILATTYNKINMFVAKVRERARKWQQ